MSQKHILLKLINEKQLKAWVEKERGFYLIKQIDKVLISGSFTTVLNWVIKQPNQNEHLTTV